MIGADQINARIVAGLVLIGGLVGLALLGVILLDTEAAFPLSGPIARPPSSAHPLGTDTQGRDLLTVMALGTLLTVKIGLVAGGLGLVFGAIVAFVAAYFGGWLDALLRSVVDVLITVPGVLVLVVVAATLNKSMSTDVMALIIAALAWREPARQIRAQVLVMREAGYVKLARLSGAGPFEIMLFEIAPNLVPYLAASFVGAVSSAVLASIGLEALGLGSQNEPTLGMTIFWLMNQGAFMRGLWWWILAPVAVLLVLFFGLYLLAAGLDDVANPRLKRVST
jgi:peptide/nickel transport system permease protein